MDIRLDSDGGIPVEDFLGASKSLIPIFGRLFILVSDTASFMELCLKISDRGEIV